MLRSGHAFGVADRGDGGVVFDADVEADHVAHPLPRFERVVLKRQAGGEVVFVRQPVLGGGPAVHEQPLERRSGQPAAFPLQARPVHPGRRTLDLVNPPQRVVERLVADPVGEVSGVACGAENRQPRTLDLRKTRCDALPDTGGTRRFVPLG